METDPHSTRGTLVLYDVYVVITVQAPYCTANRCRMFCAGRLYPTILVVVDLLRTLARRNESLNGNALLHGSLYTMNLLLDRHILFVIHFIT